ncbi:INO80 complex subunit D-like [Senna tora]|uniref:KAT8 regulatory NSL complex subunit 2 n=1 Tax=Senna tora TaxID=362788 RepID=A0A834X2Q8_9FABA|nr:INO80 complex subunit D-like [Senna tora]
MASSASKHHHISSSSSSSKIPTDDSKPNSTVSSSPLTLSLQNLSLSHASHLSPQELRKRRIYYFNLLSKCYRTLYWALLEELKNRYREYYWEYGVSPFKQASFEAANFEANAESNPFLITQRCAFLGCKLKPMPLTSFCHLHILSDSKQKLYKPCNYVIKSAQAGPITCGKPILRSTTPSLCTVHFQKAQKHLTRTLKRAGLNNPSMCKLAPKFRVIVVEFIHQIQERRHELRSNRSKIVVEEEKDN